jgi:hypothetical protein
MISSMSRLKVLYFNIDTLYPRAWTAELEEKLLTPLRGTEIAELHVIVRWTKPKAGAPKLKSSREDAVQATSSSTLTLIRVDDYESPDRLYEEHPAADMRTWIVDKLTLLGVTCA